jgi:hypothetical protein
MNHLFRVAALAVVLVVPPPPTADPERRGGDHPPYNGTLADVDPDGGTIQVDCKPGIWIGYTKDKTTITLDGKPCTLADLVGKKGGHVDSDGPKRRRNEYDAVTIAVTTSGKGG